MQLSKISGGIFNQYTQNHYLDPLSRAKPKDTEKLDEVHFYEDFLHQFYLS